MTDRLSRVGDLGAKVEYLKSCIKSIPDFPKPGILFRDITSLCEDGKAFAMVNSVLADAFANAKIDKVASAEARGFVFGAPLAQALGAGFVMIRKPNKLPREVISERYELEYGFNEMQIHVDAIKPGERVLLLDDLLATGGTMLAMVKLLQRLGAEIVNTVAIIDLFDLGGADRIKSECGIDTVSIIKFPGH
ncbi:MAG: adenine phosphoribosyltransferase [Succinivibrionaceae bacterium]|nr:adenine phosphoribosyltransferase [Succinivibrionaceae bacterium]